MLSIAKYFGGFLTDLIDKALLGEPPNDGLPDATDSLTLSSASIRRTIEVGA